MKQTLIAAVLMLAATATSALADDTVKAADNDCRAARKAGKVCMLSFDTPDDIEGQVISPNDTRVDAFEAISFTSLIRMRWDYRAEIIKAAENVW